jgi:hypothetical protein
MSKVKAHIVGTPPTQAPSNLKIVTSTISSLTWSWNSLDSTFVGGAPLEGYRIYMDRGLNDPFLKLVYDGYGAPSVTEFTQSGLVCGRTYKAQVSALNSIGEGPLSNAVEANLAITPTQPVNPRIVSSTSAQIDVAWSIPFETGCAALAGYKIERDSGNGFEYLTEVNSTSQAYSTRRT